MMHTAFKLLLVLTLSLFASACNQQCNRVFKSKTLKIQCDGEFYLIFLSGVIDTKGKCLARMGPVVVEKLQAGDTSSAISDLSATYTIEGGPLVFYLKEKIVTTVESEVVIIKKVDKTILRTGVSIVDVEGILKGGAAGFNDKSVYAIKALAQ